MRPQKSCACVDVGPGELTHSLYFYNVVSGGCSAMAKVGKIFSISLLYRPAHMSVGEALGIMRTLEMTSMIVRCCAECGTNEATGINVHEIRWWSCAYIELLVISNGKMFTIWFGYFNQPNRGIQFPFSIIPSFWSNSTLPQLISDWYPHCRWSLLLLLFLLCAIHEQILSFRWLLV